MDFMGRFWRSIEARGSAKCKWATRTEDLFNFLRVCLVLCFIVFFFFTLVLD
jgi:hypothetical protein